MSELFEEFDVSALDLEKSIFETVQEIEIPRGCGALLFCGGAC
ncbi:hypothetical protein [uncultured Murdochiella sp.]|nr:hypothetical protein [uncultured Murdochiella sp.]